VLPDGRPIQVRTERICHPHLLWSPAVGFEYSGRVERSLYERAVGYNYEAVKIFMPANREKPVIVPYIEHVPPDVTAGIFWLKNRDPKHWRDLQQLEHVLGKYLISDKPMTEEEWARERATVIDDEPRKEYGLQVDTPSLPLPKRITGS
jgi:hypothetical protein